MPFALRYRRRTEPYVYAIAAIVCAAAVVLYLQQRALTDLRNRSAQVLQEIAEQTAHAVVATLRATLEGPVFDTLTAVNHPQMRDSRLDLLLPEYRAGLASYPHIERFFVWTEQTDASVPGEVLFFGPGHTSTTDSPPPVPREFRRDQALGRQVFALARRHAPSQQIYAAEARLGPDANHDVFLRLFWTDARRDHFFAVIGFVVDRTRVRETLFPELHRRELEQLLTLRGKHLPFELRVTDEHGALIWGSAEEQPLAAKALLPMAIYPAQTLGPRLASGIEPINWTVEVSPAHADRLLAGASRGYWLPGLSIMLMLVAITVTIHAGRRAAAVARMQSEFISHVSHQLKTPLSLISAATETVELDRVQSPEKLAQYLGIIRGEVRRLSSLVHGVLEFSSLQQRQLEFDDVDLTALVRETVDAFQGGLAGQHFTFTFVQEGPSPALHADPAALEQVLANLLDNAVNYSGDIREVTVQVGWAGARAVVDVSDRGIGVPAADRAHIFDTFYRGSGDAHHRRGFGLGLAIARDLVAAHGGQLELLQTSARGSTFRMSFPSASLAPLLRPAHALERA